MIPLDKEEIATCKERLLDPVFTNKLQSFQDRIYNIFEEHRRITGDRFIRFVCPRTKLKSVDSVIDKIRRKREKQKEEQDLYTFDKVGDLAGVKVLCPYISSAKDIMEWMFRQSINFKVTPTSIDNAWSENDEGYRGWQFIAEPSSGLLQQETGLIGAKCEIQVKTMLQEAWDAQTHDISYKKRELIDDELLDHIKNQSDILNALDRQSEIIRLLIQRAEEDEMGHKRAAATAYLSQSEELLDYIKRNYTAVDLQLQKRNFCPLHPETLSQVNTAMLNYRANQGVTKNLIRFAALIALCQRDAEQEEIAISLANEFVSSNPNNPDAENVFAGVLWALNRFEAAIRYGKEAINKARASNENIIPYQANFCYWVAEAARARTNVIAEDKNLALVLSDKLPHDYPDNIGYLDTAGFVKIVFGTTIEEVERGLDLIHKARKLAEKGRDEVAKRNMLIFARRHERIGRYNISKICEKKSSKSSL